MSWIIEDLIARQKTNPQSIIEKESGLCDLYEPQSRDEGICMQTGRTVSVHSGCREPELCNAYPKTKQ